MPIEIILMALVLGFIIITTVLPNDADGTVSLPMMIIWILLFCYSVLSICVLKDTREAVEYTVSVKDNIPFILIDDEIIQVSKYGNRNWNEGDKIKFKKESNLKSLGIHYQYSMEWVE